MHNRVIDHLEVGVLTVRLAVEAAPAGVAGARAVLGSRVAVQAATGNQSLSLVSSGNKSFDIDSKRFKHYREK